jgi:uncharacterized repeat protein (TIGR03837 family)
VPVAADNGPMHAPRAWDVFCRVIDNHGDLGVAWRLSADLAARGERVRLWVDDAAALAWMAPQGQAGVSQVDWTDPAPDLVPGDVVVETFGCEPPPGFVRRMAERTAPPAWINLEYLSAEAYVERSHGLPSPVDVQGRLLTKFFFYPGFTPRSAGLLREPGLMAARRNFVRDDWLRELELDAQPGERLVSLFCYHNPALAGLCDVLGATPTLLLATPGAASTQVRAMLGPTLRRGALRIRMLPYLSQAGYDRLLWACDINFVRGEDSFVRAQWAGRPFVWQIYPQRDGAHGVKLHAFLDRLLGGADDAVDRPLRDAWLGWNALAPMPAALPAPGPWRSLCEAWRDRLLEQPDLCTQLLRFLEKMR